MIVSISPELAREILAGSRPHVNPSMNKRVRYADKMLAEEWEVARHSPLVFDADGGWLSDGNHRLHGVIIAGVTVSFWVLLEGRRQADARGHGELAAHTESSSERARTASLDQAELNQS
jgi:hypothetical protein